MKLKGLGAALVLVVGCAGSVSTPETAPPEAAAPAASPVAASAQSQTVARGMQLYATENYAAAAAAFENAYAQRPDQSLLLARAQSLRLSGDCDEARAVYAQFLASATDPTYHNAVQQFADDCDVADAKASDTHLATR
ncbi:MAG: tetratricopeptide repeat protein [Nannocystaceae bacterium]|nr:tetratricopeptide repeat protein [Nannocystaceae bacterium]